MSAATVLTVLVKPVCTAVRGELWRQMGNATASMVGGEDNGDESIINVGLIVDLGSWVGKVVQSCTSIAVSDFYNLNPGYRTRIHLHVRDSKGGSLHDVAAALELLENVDVQAIIMPEVPNKDLFLTILGNKVNVPLLSLNSISSSNEHPYFVQVTKDEHNQFHSIVALLQAFSWRSFAILYEDTADARLAQTYINEILQENDLDVGYQTVISLQATDDQITLELRKLMVKASIFLVHLPTSLASQVLRNAKRLGLMSKGIAWIMTSKTMNLLDVQDSSVYESMQGVLGFKSYPYASDKIQNLTSRWSRGSKQNNTNVEIKSLNEFGDWAYNAAWVLAEAVERTGVELSQNRTPGAESAVLRQITRSKFRWSDGKSELGSKKQVPDMFEILNVIHKGEIRVGFWTSSDGFTKEINPSINSSSNMLETIIWPGFTSTAPKSSPVQMSSRVLRIAVPAHSTFPELISLDHEHDGTIFRGFCIDVFTAAVAGLPYTISYEFIPFNTKNGSYNDLIYQVYLQNFDAAMGDITITSNRSAFVDFTLPYTELGVGVVVKLDDNDPWFFLKPLKADLWIITACFFFLTGFIVWLIEHRINEEFQGPPAQQFGTALWFAFSTLVYAHRERLKSNLSKFVVGVWLFVVLILTSSYIAKLSSLLTVEQIKLTRSDYIGYSANSFIQEISGSNLNFKDNRLKPYRLATEEYDQALRKGNRHGGVRAIMDELPYLKIFIAKFPNKYAIIESSMITNGFAFAFQKGSPLARDMSKEIAYLREEGKLQQMENKWFSSPVSLKYDDREAPNKDNPLSKENFLGLFFISGISKFIVVLMFIVFILREKLLVYRNAITLLVTGKLMVVLKYLHAKMANIIDKVETR